MSWRIQQILAVRKEESRKSQGRSAGYWEFQSRDFIFFYNAVIIFSKHDRIHEKNSQHLRAFKLWINVIHKMLSFLFRISLSHLPLWHVFLRASHFSASEVFITRIFYPYLLSRRNIPYVYCPERRKIMEVKRESVSKELQSLIT